MHLHPRFSELWLKFLQSRLTEKEWLDLDQSLSGSLRLRKFFKERSSHRAINEHLRYVYSINDDQILRKIESMRKRARLPSIHWRFLCVSVLVILLILKHLITTPTLLSPRSFADGPRGGTVAILTLGDGTQVLLDGSHKGVLAREGNSTVSRLVSGQLKYENDGTTGNVVYNSLTTPRGSQYEVYLPDGSRVWLNAASSIRYPTRFTDKERVVELSGEAYMEIVKDATRPLKVKANGAEVYVLGTRFDIEAYPTDTLRTTLIQGSVRVKKFDQEVLLQPGQQARWAGSLFCVSSVDAEREIAWKNGKFQFQSATIETVMDNLARWYDVDVHYEGKTPDRRLNALIGREENISDVLQILESSGYHFKIEGRIITVLPD